MSFESYDGMKILKLNVYFKLPNDFEGGLNDALREYIKYREDKNLGLTPYVEDSVRHLNDDNHWQLFCNGVEKEKYVCGEYCISKWNEKEKEWEELNEQ